METFSWPSKRWKTPDQGNECTDRTQGQHLTHFSLNVFVHLLQVCRVVVWW